MGERYMKRQFNFRNKEIIFNMYNNFVHPCFYYVIQFWCPIYRKGIEKLERLLAKATKHIFALITKNYEDCLRDLNLLSLKI